MIKYEYKWVLSKRQQMVVKAYIVAHYDNWLADERGFDPEWCTDDVVKFFGFNTHELECDVYGLAEEVENDKFKAEEYYWGVELGFIKA